MATLTVNPKTGEKEALKLGFSFVPSKPYYGIRAELFFRYVKPQLISLELKVPVLRDKDYEKTVKAFSYPFVGLRKGEQKSILIDIDLNKLEIDKLTGMTLGAKMNELSIQLYDIHVKSDALELNASVSD